MKTMNSRTQRPWIWQLVFNAGTILVVALMLFGYQAWAAPGHAPQAAPGAQGTTPGVISYQGTLTDADDQPVGGNVDMTFRLYDVPSGGAALWTEAHTGLNAVPVNGGLFNVLLGSLTPIPSTVWDANTLYLGVQVGSDSEMAPREVLGAVPMALTVPDGAITNQKVALSHWSDSPDSNVEITSTDIDAPKEVCKVDVNFPTDGLYLIFAKVVSNSDVADKQLYARLWDENGAISGTAAINTHPLADGAGRQTGTIVTVLPFSAGAHTIKLMAHMVTGSKGTVLSSTELIVIPLGQP